MLHVKIVKNLLVLPVSMITGIKMQMADNSKGSQHQDKGLLKSMNILKRMTSKKLNTRSQTASQLKKEETRGDVNMRVSGFQ